MALIATTPPFAQAREGRDDDIAAGSERDRPIEGDGRALRVIADPRGPEGNRQPAV